MALRVENRVVNNGSDSDRAATRLDDMLVQMLALLSLLFLYLNSTFCSMLRYCNVSSGGGDVLTCRRVQST